MATSIIGIDCATQPKNIGLAFGYLENGDCYIDQVTIGSNEIDMVSTIAIWTQQNQTTLITLDAPLGWPYDLGQALFTHEAGQLIKIKPNQLFRRGTDRFIKSKIGKQPLDVGADRIARTAHNAITLLDEIRTKTDKPIPLAWENSSLDEIYAIEVYPAATLLVHNIDVPGYKQKDNDQARNAIIEQLKEYIELPIDTSMIRRYDHVLDAVICVLAGMDFISGNTYHPENLELAKKEGWIWVRKLT